MHNTTDPNTTTLQNNQPAPPSAMKSFVVAIFAFATVAFAQGPICGNTGPQDDGTTNVCVVPGVPDPFIIIPGIDFAQCCNPDDCVHTPGQRVTLPTGQSIAIPEAWGVSPFATCVHDRTVLTNMSSVLRLVSQHALQFHCGRVPGIPYHCTRVVENNAVFALNSKSKQRPNFRD